MEYDYSSYASFLFDDDLNVKNRYAPVLNTLDDGSYLLKYSIPGYHSPRQYFRFQADLLDEPQFPNLFVSFIFGYFCLNRSLLFRNPHNYRLKPKKAALGSLIGLKRDVNASRLSSDELDCANYNVELAIKLGKIHHSLFFFPQFYQNYKLLFPNASYSYARKLFNRLISD